MKTLLGLLLLALPLDAQALFEGGTRVQAADGDDQASTPYVMSGAYVLRWVLSDKPPVSRKDDPWWKANDTESWKRQWLSVRVHAAATRERICGEMLSGKENHFNVPEGGKHYVVVTGPRNISWTIWAKEGSVEMSDKGPKFRPVTPAGGLRNPTVKQAQQEPAATIPAPPPPKPSSVPGLPAGVEPATKTTAVLPPGMTKGGEP